MFTQFHIAQCKLIRVAFQVELLQNGLRKKIVQMVITAATKDFNKALALTYEYINQIKQEQNNAEEAIVIVKEILNGCIQENTHYLKRKETAKELGISIDTLRNWEMNGLLNIKRKDNGYRVYTFDDIQRLKIIRSLRCANYSLEAILRLLQQLLKNSQIDIKSVLNTPKQSDDIVSVCDELIVSLSSAEQNAYELLDMLQEMKTQFL